MNTRLTPFLLLLALAHNVGAHDEGNKPQVSNRNNYLSQLPEDSALREVSETTPISSCSLFRGDKQTALVRLQSICKTCYSMDEIGIAYTNGLGYFADTKSIKVAIRTILQNKPDELKWQEYDHLINLVQKLNAEREQQREARDKREAEELQRRKEEKEKELLTERERPF